MRFNRFVEWTHNGGQRGRHSSMLSAPLRPIHGRRSNPNATPRMRLRAVSPLGAAEQRSGRRIRAGAV